MGEKGDATKQRIIESACKLFHSQGYHRTGIEDILKASKVKKGSFYFHFKNKEALGYAVIDRYTVKAAIPLIQPLRSDGEPLDKIVALFQRQGRALKISGYKGGCPFGLLANELSDHHPGFRLKLDAVFDSWSREVQAVLNKAQKEGKMRKSIDAEAMSRFIIALLEGSALLAKTKKKSVVYQDCVKSLRLLLESLKI